MALAKRVGITVLAFGCACLGACKSVSADTDAPAIVVTTTAENRAELLRAVTTALGRTDITLADDALTRDSELIIERVQPRDAKGLRLNGREQGMPAHFRLIWRDSRCVLLHVETGKRQVLRSLQCKPIS